MEASFTDTIIPSYLPPIAWEKKTYNLSAYIGQTIYIAFQTTTTDQFEVDIDDVVIGAAPQCGDIMSLAVASVTNSGASVSWAATNPVPAGGYEYEVRTSGAAGSGAAGLAQSGSGATVVSPLVLTGLLPSTIYTAYVRSLCAPGLGAWSQVAFTTLPACPNITTVSAAVMSNSAINYTWSATSPVPAGGYDYELRMTGVAGSGAAGLVASGNTATPNYSATGLTAASTYFLYVRTKCDATTFGTWASAAGTTLAFAPPANDQCSGALVATTNPYTYNQADGGGSTNIGGFNATCEGLNDGLWFKFTGSGAPVTVAISNVVGWDPQLSVYSGACGAFTCVSSVDSGVTSDGETLTFTSVAGTVYYVNVGYYSSTSDSPEGPFTMNISGGLLGTAETTKNPASIKIYPNPAQDEINISSEMAIKNISIMDVTGRSVSNVNLVNGKLNVSNLNSGVYILKVVLQDGTEISKKLIKK